MFFIFNLLLVLAAGLLVLVVAATASLPGRLAIDLDAPEGDWVGRARLPQAGSVRHRPSAGMPGAAKRPAVDMR